MYCINCRYYDNKMEICLNHDGIKRGVLACDFCSYCEPISDVECLCETCVYYKSEMNGTGFCENGDGLNQCVFKTDFCSCFEKRVIEEKEKTIPKVGWLYKNEEIGYIILEKINRRGLCEAYTYDDKGNKLTYTLGINSLGDPIMQVFKEKKE